METNRIASLWDDIKTMIREMDMDVIRNAKGNNSAGVRTRRNLRDVRKLMNDLLMITLEVDRARQIYRRKEKRRRNTRQPYDFSVLRK